jgi:hypothetical protein
MKQVRALAWAGVVFLLCSASIAAQWAKTTDPTVPRDAKGDVRADAPIPRNADGKPDFSGLWMRANSGPPGGPGGRGGEVGVNAAFNGRGGTPAEIQTPPFPFDPSGPPVATFGEAGANMDGGLPYTAWASDLKKKRMDLQNRDNPDANCLPMGFLQFHLQPQPRRIMNVSNPKMLLIEYEANSGLRHIYLDGRKAPPQGEPTPWWYGYSVGHWEGDTLVVETNNLRGADEDSPYDAWLDVNGSPYSRQAKITERFRRPTLGHLQIDFTIEDPKAYTKPWTVRVDQRLLPDQELIEFVCNENQQFGNRIKLNEEPASEPSSTR